MQVTAAALDALRTNFSTAFRDALPRALNVLQGLYTPIPSTGKSNTYGFLGAFPIMREWTGPKRVQSLDEYEYDVKNKPFESTIGVKRDDIEDDNLGMMTSVIGGLAEEAGFWIERELIKLIKVSTSTVCYDGQYFFDTDHPMGNGVYSNMSGDNSVQPYYYLSTQRTLKPFIFQTRKAPKFVSLDSPTDANVFNIAEFLYGVEARGAPAFGMWQMAHRCTSPIADASFQSCRDAMSGITNDEAEPLGIEPDVILVGKSNRAAAEREFETKSLPAGGDNPNFGKVKVIVSTRLP